jgi:long-chain acyl-CoA synthetase
LARAYTSQYNWQAKLTATHLRPGKIPTSSPNVSIHSPSKSSISKREELNPSSIMANLKNAFLEARMTLKPPFTVEVPGSQSVPGETIPRRNVRSPEKLLISPDEENISTVFDIVKESSKKFGDRKAVGSRKLIRTHHETKKVKKVVDGKVQEVDKNWTYFELSGYTYLSFKEYETLVLQLGSGLRNLGLHVEDRVHLFASTR